MARNGGKFRIRRGEPDPCGKPIPCPKLRAGIVAGITDEETFRPGDIDAEHISGVNTGLTARGVDGRTTSRCRNLKAVGSKSSRDHKISGVYCQAGRQGPRRLQPKRIANEQPMSRP